MEQHQNDSTTRLDAKRVAAPFTEEELVKIDAWGFERRMRNRSDVIRALVTKGLEQP